MIPGRPYDQLPYSVSRLIRQYTHGLVTPEELIDNIFYHFRGLAPEDNLAAAVVRLITESARPALVAGIKQRLQPDYQTCSVLIPQIRTQAQYEEACAREAVMDRAWAERFQRALDQAAQGSASQGTE